MPRTLRIVGVTFVVSIIIGISLGVLSAYSKNKVLDKIITVFTLIFASIPNYVLIFFLMLYFGYHLKWFPPIPPPESEGWWLTLQGIIIPVIALSLMPIAKITVLIRSEFREVYDNEYTLLLKTKGMSNHQMILRHHLKTAFIPILPELANTFIIVLSSSFILEKINNTAGVAALLFNSLLNPILDTYFFFIDINLAVLVCAFYVFISLSLVLISDVILAILDPRIRIGSKKQD
jgi:ABC-type dipeptide/oligopeptide/nickel transport system permease component